MRLVGKLYMRCPQRCRRVCQEALPLRVARSGRLARRGGGQCAGLGACREGRPADMAVKVGRSRGPCWTGKRPQRCMH